MGEPMIDLAHATAARLAGDPLAILAAAVLCCTFAFLALIAIVVRQGVIRARESDAAGERARTAETELIELKGRLAQMTEMSALRQEELVRSLNERLDRVGQNLGGSLDENGRRAAETLSALNERLAVIDAAQRTIADLSGKVISLQDILANKQARGAFGQIRMESIVEDALPKGSYRFQAQLSNGKRPDCLIHLPYAPAGIVVDAKFPLEAFEALRTAQDDAARGSAEARVRRDVGRHIEDIAAKYFLPGETQDTAMLFVPAESVYAELHDGFPDLIQKAYRSRIVIVSPNMLMLAIQTMMAILKDARMRDQAGLIQREVGLLMEDAARLRERVLEFQRHFGQLGPGLEKIVTSTEKILSRRQRIEAVDLEDRAPAPSLSPETEFAQ
jgi:DNA recombination protein RmuC